MTDVLISWFIEQGGKFDTASVGFTEFDGQGRGAIALQDIPEGHVIFSIPYDLALSTRTSSLPRVYGEETWKELKLHEGWAGLILCMMWEASRGKLSKWSTYLDSLPSTFDTPMFWSEEELVELKGTSIENKIGKDDAEREYHTKVVPAAKNRPDIFLPDLLTTQYSLQQFHIMGSRILSRSFNIGNQRGDEEEEAHDQDVDENENAMDVDFTARDNVEEDTIEIDDNDSDDDDDVEDPADIAMLPMADMLNARYDCENAKVFFEKDGLKMTTTRSIEKGDQIWNTYGNPPNSDLLRRYGHVDIIPLSEGGEGNPADVVEVSADHAVDAIKRHKAALKRSVNEIDFKERIDWWLENGGEDIFLFETDYVFPKSLISFIRLLLFTLQDWEKARDKDRLPKAKSDTEVYSVAVLLVEGLLERYPTSFKDDKTLLEEDKLGHSDLQKNKRHAVIVRLGEKAILTNVLQKLRAALEAEQKSGTDALNGSKKMSEPKDSKRKRTSGGGHTLNKKSKQ